MPNKSFKTRSKAPIAVGDPVAASRGAVSEVSPSDNSWDPNVPFHGTQEEWWDHFHRIEEGHFTPLEEANEEFKAWKKEYLAKRLI
jgi:hypothetical protein